MTTIKVKFHPSSSAGKEGAIYYQIIHGRQTRLLPSGLRIYPSEWDERTGMPACDKTHRRHKAISAAREDIRAAIGRIHRIIRILDSRGFTFTAGEIVDEIENYFHRYAFSSFMASIISELKLNGKIRTAETYTSAMSSFTMFLKGRGCTDIMLDAISPMLIESYEASLRARGNTPNTTSFYMRILRAAYNRAVDDGAIDDQRPFRHVYTGVDKTVKRALPLASIKRIKALDLTQNQGENLARDMFMMSFYLRGMSFIDMAFLRKSDLRGGYITYRRRKTGQTLTIAWTKEMQTLIDKYPSNTTPYLLPIITQQQSDERRNYRNSASRINRYLKSVGRKADIMIPLTMYCARHSWASAAKAKGIPLSVISEGMGHDSETTTQIYLASLETSVVDKANAIILRSL